MAVIIFPGPLGFHQGNNSGCKLTSLKLRKLREYLKEVHGVQETVRVSKVIFMVAIELPRPQGFLNCFICDTQKKIGGNPHPLAH